jgi:hypothetical protein
VCVADALTRDSSVLFVYNVCVCTCIRCVKGHALAVTTIAADAKGAFVTGAADGKVPAKYNQSNLLSHSNWCIKLTTLLVRTTSMHRTTRSSENTAIVVWCTLC